MKRKLLNSELSRLSLEEFKQVEKNPLVVVLDNVRSQHNIGSTFRTSDAFKVEEVVLCGISATPPSAEIHKAALGAEFSMRWTYYAQTMDAINRLREEGYTIISIEQADGAIMLNDFMPKADSKYAFIFGNEVRGVQQEVVSISDNVIEIPQYGTKHSLNISVSMGIVLWDMVSKIIKL